jgi:hypothetical protein
LYAQCGRGSRPFPSPGMPGARLPALPQRGTRRLEA